MSQEMMKETVKTHSVKEAMALLDVSRPTIMSWIADDRFPGAFKSAGATGEWNLPRHDIEDIRNQLIADLLRQIHTLELLAQS